MFTPTIEQVSADDRGEIFVVHLPDDRELVLLHSVAGSFRGGHSHDVDEIVILVSGKMRYHKIVRGEETTSIMKPTTTSAPQAGVVLQYFSFNPAGEIHMGEFSEDSWLVEYKLAKKGEWKNCDYPPYREKVKANAV